MRNKPNPLAPEQSPSTLQSAGVKRVNNLPLWITVAFFTVFVLLVAMVAMKRARAESVSEPPVRMKPTGKTTLSLAQEVISHHPRPALPPVPVAQDMPVLEPPSETESTAPKPQAPDISDAEGERIRQDKTQAFEDAVRASSAVAVEQSHALNEPRPRAVDDALEQRMEAAQRFRAQLSQLQQSQRLTPETLGGREEDSRWQLNSRLMSPESPYLLRTGAVIPGAMISGISSEVAGQIIGQVSQNVYDSATGRYLLIPQGTRLIGTYSTEVSFGQDALLIAWQRLIFPDDKALDIGSMPGSDSAGMAGFRDQVNHHYARIYGSALLMSAIVGGVSYSQNVNQPANNGYTQPTAGSVLSQALGQQLGEVTTQLVGKNLNVSPTVRIRQGYRFNITVVKDLVFPSPYQPFH